MKAITSGLHFGYEWGGKPENKRKHAARLYGELKQLHEESLAVDKSGKTAPLNLPNQIHLIAELRRLSAELEDFDFNNFEHGEAAEEMIELMRADADELEDDLMVKGADWASIFNPNGHE